jgi:hypothetical protein
MQAQSDQHQIERTAHAQKIKDINANARFNPERKRREIRRLSPNPNWITNISYWWAADGAKTTQIYIKPAVDLALVKLDGYPVGNAADLPVFGNPASPLAPGTFLCKLGYPFNTIETSWDDTVKSFRLGNKGWPLFALEGMMTRRVHVADVSGAVVAKFIETSTPGLRGQSGGPIFDTDAKVWAIQSQTHHYDLGFSPKVAEGGRSVMEHQFLNAGWGADIEEIVQLTAENGVHINIAL